MDPVISWSVSVFLAGLMITSGWHKLSSPLYYRELIKKYIPVNHSLSILFQQTLGICEIGLGFLLLNMASRSTAAIVLVVLLTLYLFLIASSLIRGIDMDCGCSGPLAKQKVSPWLLARNTILIVMSMLLIPVMTIRQLGINDILLIACTSFVVSIIYISFEHLLANQDKLNRLRGI